MITIQLIIKGDENRIKDALCCDIHFYSRRSDVSGQQCAIEFDCENAATAMQDTMDSININGLESKGIDVLSVAAI